MNDAKKLYLILSLTLAFSMSARVAAQVPVDEDGNVLGDYSAPDAVADLGNEDIPLLSPGDLQDLVGPVALYPDDLLAVVLPASTYPLQVVQAARFLEDLERDPSLEPDPDWDDAIVALVNYPEVVELLNEDLDWTWQLGEAVVAQQADVLRAVETFRDRAYAAGNLHSDEYQEVIEDDGVIEITPVHDDIIYVPYYEPTEVVVHQPRRVYYYYPEPCPIYYYPYSYNSAFRRGYFWGVTTAFTIGWATDNLRVYHQSYRGHPYYGHHYWNRHWYRRPSINVHNTIYIDRHPRINRYARGDSWRPSRRTRLRYSDQRIVRNDYRPARAQSSSDIYVDRSRRRNTTIARNTTVQKRDRTVSTGGVRRYTSSSDAQRERPNTSGSVRRYDAGDRDSRRRSTSTDVVNRDTSSSRRRSTGEAARTEGERRRSDERQQPVQRTQRQYRSSDTQSQTTRQNSERRSTAEGSVRSEERQRSQRQSTRRESVKTKRSRR